MARQKTKSRPRGLRVEIRADTGTLQITGTVAGRRIRQAPSGNGYDLKAAQDEARLLEAELLKTEWHGERRGTRPFSDAALSYLEAETRSPNHKAKIHRLTKALGEDPPLNQINQQTAIELKRKMMRPGATDRAYVDAIVMPLRAILHHAQEQGWCDMPYFKMPRITEGRTRYLLPGHVDRLIAAAAPHLQPLLTFLVGTGARMAEALELDWHEVDLQGGYATFLKTKRRRKRVAALPPAVVAALANLPHREGRVFRYQDRAGRSKDYVDRNRQSGGQIKTAWAGALKRAGLSDDYHAHDLRHSWASWHYAIHRDLLALKIEGGWSSMSQVERYAHLLPAGHEAAIRGFWHGSDTVPPPSALTA